MKRMTVDIDSSVLRELEERKQREGKTLDRLVSELLAGALARPEDSAEPLDWQTRQMRARIDLEDKAAVRRALEET